MSYVMDFSKQEGVFDPQSFNKKVTVIGAGATGSWAVLALAKLGVQDIVVYDFDHVEEHNLPNQIFGPKHVGMAKVDALAEIVELLTGAKIEVHNERVDENTDFDDSGVIVCLTDTMSSRKEIYTTFVESNPNVDLFIETRMGVDEIRLYEIDPLNIHQHKSYIGTLYDDNVAEVSACGTSLSVGATSMQLATQVAWSIINHSMGTEARYEYLENYKERVSNQIQATGKKNRRKGA